MNALSVIIAVLLVVFASFILIKNLRGLIIAIKKHKQLKNDNNKKNIS